MRRLSLTERAIILHIVLLVTLSAVIFDQLSQIKQISERPQAPAFNPLHHFAFVYQDEKNPYWDAVKEGISQAADNSQVYFEYLGPEASDMVEQLDLLNQAIASKVDGIIVQAMSEEAFTPIIDKAVEQGIPVVTIDSDAPRSGRIGYVGSDNYHAGVLAGRYIAETLKGQGEVGIIIGSFHATSQRERLKGMQDVLREYPAIRIAAAVDSNANRFLANSLAAQLIRQHPSMTMIVGTSASDGPGIAEAITRQGKEEAIHSLAFSFGEMPGLAPHIPTGAIDAVILEDPYQMGAKAVEMMLHVKEGLPVPPSVHTQVRLLTGDQLERTESR
ncbi:MAG: substrate-binding domain-containing protein [Brevibacillus sp.]|nr:substrate-binding domain-containing protein [Brevibacillus sp.]